MNQKKSSAHYQRMHRQRLREQGLVKKEVWILPGHARLLSNIEKQLRQPVSQELITQGSTNGGTTTMTKPTLWTTASLFEALVNEGLFQSGEASIELVEGAEPTILATMHEYGDLPVYVTVAGEQIIAESVMWPVSDIKDSAKFNEEVLRTHKVFPLSTISLDTLADGDSYYIMFGALSAISILSNVVFEIDTLADNVIKATDAYGEYLVGSALTTEG